MWGGWGGGKNEGAPLPRVGDAHVLLLGREEVMEQVHWMDVNGVSTGQPCSVALMRKPVGLHLPWKSFRIKTNCLHAATGKSQHQNNRAGDKKLHPETS